MGLQLTTTKRRKKLEEKQNFLREGFSHQELRRDHIDQIENNLPDKKGE